MAARSPRPRAAACFAARSIWAPALRRVAGRAIGIRHRSPDLRLMPRIGHDPALCQFPERQSRLGRRPAPQLLDRPEKLGFDCEPVSPFGNSGELREPNANHPQCLDRSVKVRRFDRLKRLRESLLRDLKRNLNVEDLTFRSRGVRFDCGVKLLFSRCRIGGSSQKVGFEQVPVTGQVRLRQGFIHQRQGFGFTGTAVRQSRPARGPPDRPAPPPVESEGCRRGSGCFLRPRPIATGRSHRRKRRPPVRGAWILSVPTATICCQLLAWAHR